MEINKFEIFIKEARKEFRDLISKYLDGSIGEMKEMIKKKLNECGSSFEETTLKECLQEEFNMYLRGI